MQFKSIKAVALATTAVMALSFPLNNSQAADNATVNAVIEAMPALDVIKVRNMDFGRWILTYDAGFDLVLDTAGNVTTTAAGDDVAIEIDTNASTAGRLDVTLPVGLNNYELDMTVDTLTDFTDGAYTLSAPTYGTVTEGQDQPITADGLAVHPVTVVTGGVPEIVTFGATITIESTPTPGVDSDGALVATFAY